MLFVYVMSHDPPLGLSFRVMFITFDSNSTSISSIETITNILYEVDEDLNMFDLSLLASITQ